MLISEDKNTSQFIIRRYEPGSLVINENTYTKSVIVSSSQFIEDWPPQDFRSLALHHFEKILQATPRILLLGTGEKLCYPPTDFLQPFYDKGIGVEVMNTSAACRTFNVLVAEGRNVMAALLIT